MTGSAPQGVMGPCLAGDELYTKVERLLRFGYVAGYGMWHRPLSRVAFAGDPARANGRRQPPQGNGLGAAMLKHLITKALEVSEIVGVRLVLVHAKDEQANGFTTSRLRRVADRRALTLMMLLPSTGRDR
jgi:hypothetical protein